MMLRQYEWLAYARSQGSSLEEAKLMMTSAKIKKELGAGYISEGTGNWHIRGSSFAELDTPPPSKLAKVGSGPPELPALIAAFVEDFGLNLVPPASEADSKDAG